MGILDGILELNIVIVGKNRTGKSVNQISRWNNWWMKHDLE